jgi:hypothetical protein
MKKNVLSTMCFLGMIFLLTVASTAWSAENESVIPEPDRMESNDIQNDSESLEESQSSYADYEYNQDTDAEQEPVNDDQKMEADVNETEEEYSDSYEYYEFENESEDAQKKSDEKQVQSDSADTGDTDTLNAEFDKSEAKEY